MTQIFRLKKGQISFEKDKIIISDEAKSVKYFALSINVFGLVLGITNLFKFYKSGDKFFFTAWLVLVIILLPIFAFTLSRSTKSSILLADVKSIKIKQRLSKTILDIKLKNNQLRRVLQIEDVENLKKHIETNFDSLTEK